MLRFGLYTSLYRLAEKIGSNLGIVYPSGRDEKVWMLAASVWLQGQLMLLTATDVDMKGDHYNETRDVQT